MLQYCLQSNRRANLSGTHESLKFAKFSGCGDGASLSADGHSAKPDSRATGVLHCGSAMAPGAPPEISVSGGQTGSNVAK